MYFSPQKVKIIFNLNNFVINQQYQKLFLFNWLQGTEKKDKERNIYIIVHVR